MSDKTGSHLALEDRILWALEPDEAGPLHMAKLRAESSQQAKAICGERKHPGPWKVFGGENTEAILDGNGDIVVQARPLEGGRAVLEFGSEEARNVALAAPELLRALENLVHKDELTIINEYRFVKFNDPNETAALALIARLEETA
jgi:hypothetical protein